MSAMNEQGTFEYVRDLALRVEQARSEAERQYSIKPENMARFNAVYDFFGWLAEDSGGEVKRLDVNPRSIHASVSVEVPMVDLGGEEMARFVDTLGHMDMFSIKQATPSSLLIEASVNDVWEVAR